MYYRRPKSAPLVFQYRFYMFLLVVFTLLFFAAWHYDYIALPSSSSSSSSPTSKTFVKRSDDQVCDVVPPGEIDLSKIERISWDPRAFVYHNFMSEEECDHFIQLALDQGLKRSQVAAGKDGDSLSDVRTSYGVFLNSPNDAVIQRIEERIAKWTHLPRSHGEQFYFLRYEAGQQYKPHHDYFHEHIEGMEKYLGRAGQRTATVLLYLHSPDEGGETVFPHINKLVPANRGDALLFWSHTPEHTLDPHSLHGGTPVVRGTKYSATKWIRVNPYH